MKALVTGGAGFIGSHIVDALIARGYSVAIVDDLSTGREENVNAAAKLYVIDVAAKDLAGVMDEEKPDVIFHEAAQMDVRKSVADPLFDANVNIMGGINIYENAVRVGVKKVIFASSGGTVYGEQEIFPAPESHRYQPLSPYGIAKLTNEYYLYFYNQTHGLKSVALRYANVYGPRQNPHGEAGVVAIFTSRLLKGETPTINGTGKQTRDYTYVGDVVAANMAALDYDGEDVAAFNVGTALETDVNELYEHIRNAVGTDIQAPHGPGKAGEQFRSVLAWDKLHAATGWSPEVSLAEGIGNTVEWFRQRQ